MKRLNKNKIMLENGSFNEVEKPSLNMGAVSIRYLSAEKAKQMTIESQKEIVSKEYNTKCVLEQIEETTQNGGFEIQTYDDDKIHKNLVLLGYVCSELSIIGMMSI